MYAGIYRISIKEAIAYRFSMIASILIGPLNLLVLSYIWTAVYATAQTDVIGGLLFEEMIIYLITAYIAIYILWDNIPIIMRDDVKDGTFVRHLLKPYDYIAMIFTHKLGHRSLAVFIEFIPVIIIMCIFFGPAFVLSGNIAAYLVVLFFAFIISTLLSILVGTLAFWFTNPSGMIWTYRMITGFLQGTLIPLTFFPETLQKIFFFLPFQFMAFVPAQMYLGFYELGGYTLNITGVIIYGSIYVVVLYILTLIAWKISVNKFSGAGT